MKDFETFIAEVVEPVRASTARKRAMREELLTHLTSAYEEEIGRNPDAETAAAAARRRFGNTDELRTRLQASVPLLDRLLSTMNAKENPMPGRVWIVAWFVVLAGFILAVPGGMRVGVCVTAVIGSIGIWRLTQEQNNTTRWLGPRWGWRIVALLFGLGIILPALAQFKHGRHSASEAAGPVALGVLIMLIGFVSMIHALMTRRAHAA